MADSSDRAKKTMIGAPIKPSTSPAGEGATAAGSSSPGSISRSSQATPQAPAASQRAVSAATIENVIVSSQSSASMPQSVSSWSARRRGITEPGLEMTVSS